MSVVSAAARGGGPPPVGGGGRTGRVSAPMSSTSDSSHLSVLRMHPPVFMTDAANLARVSAQDPAGRDRRLPVIAHRGPTHRLNACPVADRAPPRGRAVPAGAVGTATAIARLGATRNPRVRRREARGHASRPPQASSRGPFGPVRSPGCATRHRSAGGLVRRSRSGPPGRYGRRPGPASGVAVSRADARRTEPPEHDRRPPSASLRTRMPPVATWVYMRTTRDRARTVAVAGAAVRTVHRSRGPSAALVLERRTG